jgi:hypothetical protein
MHATMTRLSSIHRAASALGAVALLASLAAPPVAADEWPALRAGRWQFDRTIESSGPTPGKVSRTACVDPTADFSRQREQLTRAGCTFSPVVRAGNVYRYSADCRMAGVASRSESVLAVDGTDSYTLKVESRTDGSSSRETLIARRIGDCAR